MRKEKNKNYFSPNEAAEMLRVSPITLRQWAQKGLIQAFITAGGHRRFALEELERFGAARGIVLNGMAGGIDVLFLQGQSDDGLTELLRERYGDDRVAVAVDAFDAGRKIQHLRPRLFVVDLTAPNLNYPAICQNLKSDPLHCRVHVIGVGGTPSDHTAFRAAGADGCIAAGWTPHDFFSMTSTLSES